MKNSLMVPFVFFTNLVVWICLISFFSLIGTYEFSAAFTQRQFAFFFSGMLYRSIYILPLAVFLSFINIFLYLMRHKTVLFVTFPLIVMLMGISVLFVMSFSWGMLDRFEQYNPALLIQKSDATRRVLSAGLIRPDIGNRRVIWNSINADGSRVYPLIAVNPDAPHAGVETLTVYESGTFNVEKNSLVFGSWIIARQVGSQDPLIVSSLRTPRFLSSIQKDVATVLDHFRLTWSENPLYSRWVVGSFSLAVLSLGFLCFATGWRLLNLVLLATAFRMLFLAYRAVYSPLIHDQVARFLPAFISPNLASPLVYVALAVLLCLVGFFVLIKRRLSHTGSEALYD